MNKAHELLSQASFIPTDEQVDALTAEEIPSALHKLEALKNMHIDNQELWNKLDELVNKVHAQSYKLRHIEDSDVEKAEQIPYDWHPYVGSGASVRPSQPIGDAGPYRTPSPPTQSLVDHHDARSQEHRTEADRLHQLRGNPGPLSQPNSEYGKLAAQAEIAHSAATRAHSAASAMAFNHSRHIALPGLSEAQVKAASDNANQLSERANDLSRTLHEHPASSYSEQEEQWFARKALEEVTFGSSQEAIDHHSRHIREAQEKIAQHSSDSGAWGIQARRTFKAAIPLHERAKNLWESGADPKDAKYASAIANKMSKLAGQASDAAIGKGINHGEDFDALVRSLEAAVDVLKGEFRGGDPEWLAQKKRDKDEEVAEEGDAVSRAISVLKGEGDEGAFRGGDPEELQRKREEKRQAQEEEGGASEQEADAGEEPDMADIEEAQQKEQDRLDAAGKAFPFGIADAGNEVSPVDTLEDYTPRNQNGDSFYTNYPTQKDIKLSPTRPGPNQWKPWSEVLGFKVPPEGAPWQHLRRYILSGDSPEKIQHEANLLARSICVELVKGLEDNPGLAQETHDAFFLLYDNLNRGLCWNPHNRIFKAEKGEVVPDHKYIYRWMGDQGEWEYSYTNDMHKENHGIQHTGNRQGHTVEIHPEWQGMDPGASNPKAAFDFTRAKAMEEGGTHPFQMLNPVTNNLENRTLTIKPGVGQPLEVRDDAGKLSRFRGFEGFEEHFRANHLNTEHDIHGNPWIQWMSPSTRSKTTEGGARGVRKPFAPTEFKELKDEAPNIREKRYAAHQAKEAARLAKYKEKEKEGRIRMRYVPGTPYPGSTPSKVDPKTGLFQGSSGVAALRKRIEKERHDQLVAVGMATEDKKPKFDILDDKPFTNMVQQGLTRSREDAPIIRGGKQLTGSRRVWKVHWKDEAEKDRVINGIYDEHEGLAYHTAANIVKKDVKLERSRLGLPPLGEKAEHTIVKLLGNAPVRAAIARAVTTYDPTFKKPGSDPEKGTKFTSYLHKIMVGEQKKALYNIVDEVSAGLHHEVLNDSKDAEKVKIAVNHPSAEDSESFPSWSQRAQEHIENTHKQWHDVADDAYQELVDRSPNATPSQLMKIMEETDKQKANYDRQRDLALGKLKQMNDTYATPGHDPALDNPEHFEKFASELVDEKDNPLSPESTAMMPDEERNKYRRLHPTFVPNSATNVNAEDVRDILARAYQDKATPGELREQKLSRLEQDQGPYVRDDINNFKFEHPELKRIVSTIRPRAIGDLLWHVIVTKPLMQSVPPEVATEIIDELKQHKKDSESRMSGKKVSKAMPQPAQQVAQQTPPDVSYIGSQGDPGATQYLYEAGPGGNVVQGTNAPEGHTDHIPDFGSPQVDTNEPTPETQPGLFDEQGRKLDRVIPPDAEVEDNPAYNPDKTQGNYWAKRFADPQTGDMQYAYLHRDQILDPRMKHNMAVKHADVQLPKIREWYQSMMASDDESNQVLGLFVALIDQGRIPMHKLDKLRVSDVQVDDGNIVTFNIDGNEVRIAADPSVVEVLTSLLSEKEPGDNVFTMNGNTISTIQLNKFMHQTFGVTPSALSTYHATKDFSSEFQNQAAKNGSKSPLNSMNTLYGIKDKSVVNVAKKFGATPEEVAASIDPIAMEASMMAAHLQNSGEHVTSSEDTGEDQLYRSMVWPVSSNQHGKTKEEDQFSRWVHSYPIHEHDMHWQAFNRHYQRHKGREDQRTQMEIQRPQGLSQRTMYPEQSGAIQ